MEQLLKRVRTRSENGFPFTASPLHAVVTSEFKRNVKDLLSPLEERGIAGGLFFARKANKLPWFVTAAKEAGIGVDTASLHELRETLGLGVNADQVTVTAVGKERELIAEAVASGFTRDRNRQCAETNSR